LRLTLVAGCVAPYALDPEVTDTVPGDTLGAMIACNFTELTAVFDQFYQAGGGEV
jgi:hypothetical protein